MFLHSYANKPGQLYPLVHLDNPQDYYGYLAFTQQGMSGYWLRYHPYITGPVVRGIFHEYYTLAGKVAWLLHVPSYIGYHLVRLGVVEIFLVSSYVLASYALGRRYALWGALFALLGTFAPAPWFYQKIVKEWYPYSYPFWESFEAIERLNTISHQMFGQAMMVLYAILLYRFFRSKRVTHAILASISCIIGGVFFPPLLPALLFSTVGAYGLFFIQRLIIGHTVFKDKRLILGMVLLGVCMAATVGFLRLQETQGFGFSITRSWELQRWDTELSFPYAMKFLFGILPLLALPAALRALHKGKIEDIFLALWAYFPYLIYPVSTLLGVPKIRLLHAAPYVSFGILAAQTVFMLTPKWKKGILQIFLCILFFVPAVQVLVVHLHARIETVLYFIKTGDQSHFHLSTSEVSALDFIAKHIPKESMILSQFRMGNVIPAFAPTRSFLGYTLTDGEDKKSFADFFFSQSVPDSDALGGLQSNDIQYIYYGIDEKKSLEKPLQYSFLTSIFSNENVEIYKANY